MFIQKISLGLSVFISSSLVMAGTMGDIPSHRSALRPVVALQGGYASLNQSNKTSSYFGTDNDVFTYTPNDGGRNKAFIGTFVGLQSKIPFVLNPDFFMHTGVEFNYFWGSDVAGVNTVGVEPQTSTLYHYKYHLQTQQVLGTLRAFYIVRERFHPYAEVGLGAAFNEASGYSPVTMESGSLNLTPGFSNQQRTRFSYSLGVGLESKLTEHVRLGLGYRYSDFGSAQFGAGTVVFKDYQASVPFRLGTSHNNANQFLARIGYVV